MGFFGKKIEKTKQIADKFSTSTSASKTSLTNSKASETTPRSEVSSSPSNTAPPISVASTKPILKRPQTAVSTPNNVALPASKSNSKTVKSIFPTDVALPASKSNSKTAKSIFPTVASDTTIPPSVLTSNESLALPSSFNPTSCGLTSCGATDKALDTSCADSLSLISDVSSTPTLATIPESVFNEKCKTVPKIKTLKKISKTDSKAVKTKATSSSQPNSRVTSTVPSKANSKTNNKNPSRPTSSKTNSATKIYKNKMQISPRNDPKPKTSKVTISTIPPIKNPPPIKNEPNRTSTKSHTTAINERKSMHNSAFTTQVNRLLKQNTQQLFENLSPEVRKAFQTLFDRIDVTDSGAITAKEIQHLIRKHTNKNLTLSQVQKVLCDLDVKGTGDIEFDEFIFMLSQPSNYVRLLDKRDLKGLKGGNNKETKKILDQKQDDSNETTYVFFEALRNATKQDSMTALRTFYKNRLKKLNDHVIHDWSAGQRCIGLSDQEMLKRYETIQGELLRQRVNFCKDNSYKTSPYARPLEWGVMNLREAIVSRRLKSQELKTKKVEPRRVKMSEFVVTPKAVPLPRYSIEKRSPLKRTFNYDQLADIRNKVDDIGKDYYGELKRVAGENSKVIQKEIAVDEIKSKASQANFMHTFEAYCAPFVVSPWIPMPSPTLQASFSPLGRSKHSSYRPTNTVIYGNILNRK